MITEYVVQVYRRQRWKDFHGYEMGFEAKHAAERLLKKSRVVRILQRDITEMVIWEHVGAAKGGGG
jgi:hypothetical protein